MADFKEIMVDGQVYQVKDETARGNQGGYEPPAGGIPKTDLASDVQTSLGKADTALQQSDKTQLQSAIDTLTNTLNTLIGSGNVQGAIDTFNEVKAFLNGINTDDPTLANQLLALQTALAGKISGIKTSDNTPLTPDSNGIVTLPPAGSTISPATASPSMDGTANVGSSAKYAREDHVHPHDTSKLSKSDVSVETQGDGTVDINVKDDTYTINLNHTHENMAKLIVCEESDLPSTLDTDTIYGVEEDGEISVLYVGGIPFYGGGGGGTSTPVLRQPADGSTINVGAIASGESSVTKTITVKGKNLTQALTVAVTGTGYSVNKQSIPAADANVGTTLTITCTNTADEAAGTLSLASSEVSCDCDLVANLPTYESLAGVKLTGSQWLKTPYKPKATTTVTMICRFEENEHTIPDDQTNHGYYFMGCEQNSSSERFLFYAFKGAQAGYVLIAIVPATPIKQIMNVTNFLTDRSEFKVSPQLMSFTPNGGTAQTEALGVTPTMLKELEIGRGITDAFGAQIFNFFDLTIYELTISEGNTTVHHYLPRLKNGVPGLYDTVTNTFISSETSTELVAIPLT